MLHGAASAQDKPKPGKEMKAILAKIPDASSKEVEQIASQLSGERAELERQLILQLTAAKSKHHKIVVVYLLGLYRMDRAVRNLADLITLEAEVAPQGKESLWDVHPAVEALARIGSPAVPVMLEKIQTSRDKQEAELCVVVLRTVLGRSLARHALADAIAEQADAAKLKQLRTALESLKAKPPE